jgi:hypothetical protein
VPRAFSAVNYKFVPPARGIVSSGNSPIYPLARGIASIGNSITNAYFQHALGGVDASTETRFVPRAFSAVNYKFVPPARGIASVGNSPIYALAWGIASRGNSITNAYFQHAHGWVDASTETRFVPRAFSAVNYKLVPFGTINGGTCYDNSSRTLSTINGGTCYDINSRVCAAISKKIQLT